MYRNSTDGVSKVVEEAYQHYEAMELGTEAKEVSDQARRIKLIRTNYNEVHLLFLFGLYIDKYKE